MEESTKEKGEEQRKNTGKVRPRINGNTEVQSGSQHWTSDSSADPRASPFPRDPVPPS